MPKKNNKNMEEIATMLEEGVENLFTTDEYKNYLQVMSKFHEYSFNNQLLIASQRPDSTAVAGYKTWERNFGRHVKKGERGIKIVAPMPVQIKRMKDVKDENGNPIMAEDGTTKKEEVNVTIPRFRVVTVFDISQTEGPDLPERPGVRELTASVKNFDSFLEAIQKISPVPVRFDTIEGSAHGYYDATAKEIVIKKGMSQSQTVKTAVHELAHAYLHDPDVLRSRGSGRVTQTDREVQAESVAFMVCSQLGIDSAGYTFPYIAAWAESIELKELREHMTLICDTATDMVEKLTEEVTKIELEKDISCREQIEKSINENYEDCRLDTEKVIKDAVDAFDKDRVERILATTVHLKAWDGRFTPQVKHWAEDYTKDANFDEEDIEKWPPYVLSSHPALVDGIIKKFIALYDDQEIARDENDAQKKNMWDMVTDSALKKMHRYQDQEREKQSHTNYIRVKRDRGERTR